MKIKRFFAPDIRQAMRMVREEQGPDAVILSNRNVDGGVEIVAAQDFDEKFVDSQLTPHPQQDNSNTEKNRTVLQPKAKAKIIQNPNDRVDVQSAPKNRLLENKASQSAAISKAIHPHNRVVRSPEQVSSEIATIKYRDAQEKDLDYKGLHKEIMKMRQLLDVHLSETAWAQSVQKEPTRIDLLRHFSNYGLSKKLCMELANQFGTDDDFELAKRKGMENLVARIPLFGNHLIDSGGVIALVGPTGVGKTTTIAKLAARFRMKHGPNQVALISTDHYRIGASEQLNIYGRILGIPVRTASSPEDLQNLLNGFTDRRLVLIDSAGMGQHDERLARQRSLICDLETPVNTFLVMSAASQFSVMREVVKAFHEFQPIACILTKLDEAAYLGMIISIIVENSLALAFVTDGQRVPEDIHTANPDLLVEKCFQEDLEIQNTGDHNPGRMQYQDWLIQANV